LCAVELGKEEERYAFCCVAIIDLTKLWIPF